MKITGKITKVLPVRTGTSKKGSTWAAQQFVLETEGDGAMLLEVFGQKEIDEFAITEGEKLTVTYVPKVHEARRQGLRQEQRHRYRARGVPTFCRVAYGFHQYSNSYCCDLCLWLCGHDHLRPLP
jgi:hypothetical protein